MSYVKKILCLFTEGLIERKYLSRENKPINQKQMEKTANVKLTEAGTQLLKRLMGERISFFITDNIKIHAIGCTALYWAPEFAISLTKNKQDQRFINISADYKLSPVSSTTYYAFDIEESKTPLRCDKLLQSGHYSEIKIHSAPVLMIEVYQDCNQELDECICYDAAILIYTENQKYLLKVREELVGGVNIILTETLIDAELSDLKLRKSLM